MEIKKAEAKVFSETIFSMSGISKKTVEEHLKLYQGYVNKYNEIQEGLVLLNDDDYGKANQSYSKIRELKVELSFAWGGIVNHEIYFGHLGGKGGEPSGSLLEQIKKDFGNFDVYKKEMKATGLAARGWVWTAWNYREKDCLTILATHKIVFRYGMQNRYWLWTHTSMFILSTMARLVADISMLSFANMDWEKVEENFKSIVG